MQPDQTLTTQIDSFLNMQQMDIFLNENWSQVDKEKK